MRSLLTLPAALALTGFLYAPLQAQDSRNVTEPKFPPVCAELKASLEATTSGIAETDEHKLDSQRIQSAIDKCGKGKAVALRTSGSNNAFLSGPLELREGVTLLVDKGVTLYASRDADVFAVEPGKCGLVTATGGRGCKPLISVNHVSGAGIMGDGTIDGRGGSKILDKKDSWWDLAEQARAGGSQQVPRILVADYANDFTLYRITLKNSPNFHVVYNHGDGFTVWGLRIDTPKRLARNTDGVDPGGGSKNITITHSFIRTGDDNVAIKGGPGGVTNMTVAHNHFYWGHGMSIGSETNGGVSALRVTDLSLDGPDSGIRIKSMGTRGGLVHDAIYQDICIRDSPRPIDITMSYAANGPVKGPSPPTFRDINLKDVRVAGGGLVLFDGYDHTHRAQVNLDGVYLLDLASPPKPYTYTFDYADITYASGGSNIHLPEGNDVTVTGKPSEGKPASCTEKFTPFPTGGSE
jgi:polygalacturonase